MQKATDPCDSGVTAGDLALLASRGVGAGDLRRRRSRELSEVVVRFASFASASDRALLESVYRDGLTAVQVARMTGERPRTVRRRVRRLVERMTSARFAYVVRHRGSWGARRRAIATACVLHGATMREAAARTGTSLHAVRKELAAVDGMVEASVAAAAAGRAGVGGGRAWSREGAASGAGYARAV